MKSTAEHFPLYAFGSSLSFAQTAERYNNDANDGWCGVDDHAPHLEGPAVYEAGVADFDNDGDLDILNPHGPHGQACADVEYVDCEESNWVRLSLSHAAESSSFDGDFYFIDEAGNFDDINGRIYWVTTRWNGTLGSCATTATWRRRSCWFHCSILATRSMA
jgi:hypothetical protein